MFLIGTVRKLLKTWRQRRGGPQLRTRRRDVAMEQLDHRQLLAVNFTGNVALDFPATKQPGVVVLGDNPSVQHPQIPPSLQSLVKVSGFDINGIRVSYDSTDDTLSIGLGQPDNQTTGQPVIAGDSDNNQNSATVNTSISFNPGGTPPAQIDPGFRDFADLGGSETMGAFLDLTGSGIPTIVAGVSDTGSKFYQVAEAVVNPVNPSGRPLFGTALPANTGDVYLVNDPAHGAFEFRINKFSQLYQQETGQPLTADRRIAIGAFGNSNGDDGISEAFFPSNQTFRVGDATVPLPPTPPVCPPVSPPIYVNIHDNSHIDTVHDTLIRVTVLGSSGFNVRDIDVSSVRFGGAAPAFSFIRKVNADQFADRTFVFRGPEVSLPPGFTTATITGNLLNQPANAPTTFSSSATVFNLSPEFYTTAEVNAAEARQAARDKNNTRPVPKPGLSGYQVDQLPQDALNAIYSHKAQAARFVPLNGGGQAVTATNLQRNAKVKTAGAVVRGQARAAAKFRNAAAASSSAMTMDMSSGVGAA